MVEQKVWLCTKAPLLLPLGKEKEDEVGKEAEGVPDLGKGSYNVERGGSP